MRARHLYLSALAVLLVSAVSAYSPQNAPPAPAPGATLTPQQLDDLVAPIALYPDPLVAQVLAASTYPMEVAEADQWVRDHSSWKPSKLMDKAKKEKWDPSVQALVAFPDVLKRLTEDMNWTTQLGNAFLAQQNDVMQAVQAMRAQAQAKGTLKSTPQETVSTEDQNGQQAISIEPTDPDMWYVPYYNPAWAWGPPAWGAYPPLVYPGIDVGFGWDPGIDLGLWFGGWGGWGWGGWGWSPNWFGGGIGIDYSFFHRYGYRTFGPGGVVGTGAWMHNPVHRLGVPYANPAVARRFAAPAMSRAPARLAQRPGTPQFEQRSYTAPHSVFGGYHDGGMARMQSDRGFSSMGAARIGGGGGMPRMGGGTAGGGARAGGGGRR